MTIMPTSNDAESSFGSQMLRMKSTHLFTDPAISAFHQIHVDANPACIRRDALMISGDSLEPETTIQTRKVSDDALLPDTCLTNSLVMQLSGINITEEKTSSTEQTKLGSLQFSLSKPMQNHIKHAIRASAPPSCLTPKKRVHSRRRNRVVILNNKIMTSTQGRRGSNDSCLHFESISLGVIVTP